jgi:DNA-3-methyladenine glycosylase
MTDRRRLSRRFLSRPSADVAPDLLGRVLVRMMPDGTRLAARIVEAEAYAEWDAASHSFRGQTARTRVMFGPAGHLYVYFTYGMHFCMNVVTGRAGEGSAVLLRAAEPLEGLDRMRQHRGLVETRLLCSGPARLCQALAVDRRMDGSDIVAGEAIWLERGRPSREIVAGPRVGVTREADRPWRFRIDGDPFVSRGRPSAMASDAGPRGITPASSPSRS